MAEEKEYEELTRLNNELVNLQRELVRANAEIARQRDELAQNFAEAERSRLALLNILEDAHQTQRQLAQLLHDKEVLLREVHHRVKNNLQVIISLLNLQMRQIGDSAAAEVLQTSQQRIRAIAAVYERLYQSEDFGQIDFLSYVNGLVRQLSVAYALKDRKIEIATQIEDFTPAINIAVPLGLLVNELVTNALKHAFQGRASGRIDIIAARIGDHVGLTVRDDGNGLPEGIDTENGGSLGFTLIRLLTQQLKGTLSIERNNGTAVTIEFPLGNTGCVVRDS